MTRFLFTTLPSDDLGLLARSLPIARELTNRGHRVAFCSPAPAPQRLLASAGFPNYLPRHPLYDLIASDPSFGGFLRYSAAGHWRQRYGTYAAFLRALVSALPRLRAPRSADVWNMDHAAAMMGLLNEGFVRASCTALQDVMRVSRAQVVVDFWNPLAVIAARALGLPVATVIQGDAHPASTGFLWWRPPPPNLPTPVPILNRVLESYQLPPVTSVAELSIGDLTLVTGMPQTDPLPPGAAVTYVGALLWQPAEARLPAQIAALSRDRPVIWVYAGNPHYASGGGALDSAVIIHTCIAELAGGDAHVVLTTGYHHLPRRLRAQPTNVHVAPYVPGLAMAEHSDLLIHHGGYGSCQLGLVAGRPAVMVPTYA